MDIRPTSDRLRETLFNVLNARNRAALDGSVWLDLFAGTGAVGIEALSRGAAWVYFVESSPRAARVIEQNLRSLGIKDGFQVVHADVLTGLKKFQVMNRGADFVFLDPPYRMQAAYQDTLDFLANSSALLPASIVVAEHDRKSDPGEAFGPLRRYRKLEQGDAALSFYRLSFGG